MAITARSPAHTGYLEEIKSLYGHGLRTQKCTGRASLINKGKCLKEG